MITSVENLLNRGLPRSPAAQQLCAELSGRTLGVNILGVGRWVLKSTGSSLQITRSDAGTDAGLTGGVIAMVALAGSNPEAVLQSGRVHIEGDAELARRYRELLELLRPDVEEELSHLVGDIPAHHLGRFTSGALDWTRKAAQTTLTNISEYLAHESRDLVSRPEANQFLQGVDTLREDVDRLAARLTLLEQRQRATSPPRSL